MNDHFSSEQRLVALRGLLERNEIYASIFARIALVAGSLSILTAVAMFVNDEVTPFLHRLVRPREFAIAWIVVLMLSTIAGGIFVSLRTRSRDDRSGSLRIKVVLATIAPYLLIPAAFTAWFFATGYLGGTEVDLVVVWMAFYALVLLSTAFFAPRSIVLLGWVFLLSALAAPVIEDRLELWIGSVPAVMMGATFGFYHLIYVTLNWRPKIRRP